MQSYDEGVKILQWNDDTTQHGLDHISKFPKTITSLKKYFDKARPQNNGGQVYVKVRIGLPITSEKLLKPISEDGQKVKIFGFMSAPSNTTIPDR